MYRSILAAVKPAPAQEFVIEYACELAQRHSLAVDGLCVIDLGRLAPLEPVPLGAGTIKVEHDRQVIAAARTHAAEAMSRIEASARLRGVTAHGQVQEGEITAVLADAVQRCDLLVCGHTQGGDHSERSLLFAILKHSPRPAIVVPRRTTAAGQSVLAAYDGSVQAARALAALADSGLAEGRTVHILSCHADPQRAALLAETARAFLARHGRAAQTQTGNLDSPVAQQVLAEARRVSAGLIVIGAFGHGVVREFLFGSTTRSLLDELPVPVLLDH